jgi:hypothetical protein
MLQRAVPYIRGRSESRHVADDAGGQLGQQRTRAT